VPKLAFCGILRDCGAQSKDRFGVPCAMAGTNGMILSHYWCIFGGSPWQLSQDITLTDQQDDWIKAQVEGGDYTNDSEYIRDLIRREQERGAEIEVVSRGIDRG